ncbi:MAG: hypothetical protein D6761_00750 [Candidatus Dadabacteria bacterium]|nr:MAG: hypothetical protein D6761_00750 [Candidatus Dadabacteria bacterium]
MDDRGPAAASPLYRGMSGRILSVSDAHLFDLNAPDAQAFLAFLERPDTATAQLVVLNGDIFDFFVGRQRVALRHYAPVLERIETLATRTQVVFVQGNHDFHLDRVLSSNVAVVDQFDTITSAGLRVRWLHGDYVAPSRGYLAGHRALRSSAALWLTEHLPAHLAWQLALTMSRTSRDQGHDATPAQLDALRPQAARAARGSDLLVTGHFHCPHVAQLDGGGTWVSVGPWLNDCWYLSIEGDQWRVQQFDESGVTPPA